MKKLYSGDPFLSEDALVAFLKQKIPRFGATLGIGDDAAIISAGNSRLVITTDSLVENVHFQNDWVTPQYLGKKAARSNLSDIAAMGAVPRYALISLVLPKQWYKRSIISQLYDGFEWAFKPLGVEIVGGNVSSGKLVVISLTIIGERRGDLLLRSGAEVGDLLFCTGSLGIAAQEVSELTKKKKKLMTIVPPDRTEFGQHLASEHIASSCIDISDGLAIDLLRLCKNSSVGARIIEGAIPGEKNVNAGQTGKHFALYGGEDYELLFTVPKSHVKKLRTAALKTRTPVHEIGVIQDQNNLEIILTSGRLEQLSVHGWDHMVK